MAYDIKFSNSWVIMSFSPKALYKRLKKIVFSKRDFWIQTALRNSCQPNTNSAILASQNSSTLQKSSFLPKNSCNQTPPKFYL